MRKIFFVVRHLRTGYRRVNLNMTLRLIRSALKTRPYKSELRNICFFAIFLILAACTNDDNPAPKTDVTLEPSQIAANLRVTLTASPVSTDVLPPTATPTEETQVEPTEEVTRESTENAVEAAIQPTTSLESTAELQIETPQALPTSNAAEIKALQDNGDLFLTMRLEQDCFAANDFIPFTLDIINVSANPIYFYKNGLWRLSINNSSLGPQLAIQEPQLRDDFVTLAPNSNFIQNEDDLGLWVQSLGPDSGIPLTPTGIGLPAGDYWITFVYSNDKNGLTEQPDGTYLIDRSAWLGTTVASEKRLRVVDDISECE